ncbi:MAG: spore photoproduct lyase [Firmicutes bacterium]|nr:spore photoproduct lyase [Bacillota bacterium]
MKVFQPKRVFFEEDALNYQLGQSIYNQMIEAKIPIKIIGSHNRVTGIPGTTPQQSYLEGKRTLVVGIKKDLSLDTCKPSADFEFSMGTSCPGGCQYCYLQTHLGRKPYVRVYVNLEDIFNQIKEITAKNHPRITTFEAASTSDPLAVEHITGSLSKAIEFFGKMEHARLRVVTKFASIDPLLKLAHNNHTKFRFSLNTKPVIQKFEPNTAVLAERISAAKKITQAGYPLGFIVEPLFVYQNYEKDYCELFKELSKAFDPPPQELSFELITHRFTKSAKKIILERFPDTKLDLEETSRRKKFGKYGLVKYLYPDDQYQKLKQTILKLLGRFFPSSQIEYFT